MQKLLTGVGRIFLGALFLLFGIYSIVNWDVVLTLFQGHLCAYLNVTPSGLSESMLSWSTTLQGLACLFEILGALCLIFGCGVRFGAFLLSLVLVPATVIFHPFWTYQGEVRSVQMVMFAKNLSIFGGLLLALAYGGKRRKGAASAQA